MLESYDGTGAARQTPMDAVGQKEVLYARTDPNSNKVKRIRANPRVRVALSDIGGKPKGPWFEGEARLLEGREAAEARKYYRKGFGFFAYIIQTFMGLFRHQHLTHMMTIQFDSAKKSATA